MSTFNTLKSMKLCGFVALHQIKINIVKLGHNVLVSQFQTKSPHAIAT